MEHPIEKSPKTQRITSIATNAGKSTGKKMNAATAVDTGNSTGWTMNTAKTSSWIGRRNQII